MSPVGPDKVLPLEDAIERWVRPRTTLHFAFTHNRPAASMAALLRRFRGTSPGFTLAHLFTAGPAIAMLSEGLVRKLVTALVLEPYPAPAPSRPARRALANGDLELEHHSVLSYVARLQAAALGLPGLPVRGPAGTTMAEEPPEAFRERPDGLVEARPLVPDLSFVHAPCADRHGNVLLAPPCAEGTWGALAAREGVVVTVERLVEPEVLRRHALLPSVPSHRVRSVSVAPMGAHPAGQAAGGIEGVEAYGDDVAFYSEGRAAGRSETDWQRWVERWLLEPADRETYLARLGPERADGGERAGQRRLLGVEHLDEESAMGRGDVRIGLVRLIRRGTADEDHGAGEGQRAGPPGAGESATGSMGQVHGRFRHRHFLLRRFSVSSGV